MNGFSWPGRAARGGAPDADLGIAAQTMAADLVTRGDGWERGSRSVLLANDRVSVEVVVDRALDLAGARVDGIPVGWRSPTPIVAPWFVEQRGFGPHRAFFGGLLTTGGLDHIGAPATASAERFGYAARELDELPMHGRLNGSPAVLRGYGVDASDGGMRAWVAGEVQQVAVFGENLVLERRIELRFGETRVRVEDRIRNLGYATSPLALLYHVNAGWPVAAPGALIRVPGRAEPLEPLEAPDRDELERIRLHGAGGGRARAAVTSRLADDEVVGMRVDWDAAVLPTLVEWRLLRGAGHYAVALEPTTFRPEGASPVLEPGEAVDAGIGIELVHERVDPDGEERP
ncbi:MAG: DUF4432 family protein [Protaetiibacter sp.]